MLTKSRALGMTLRKIDSLIQNGIDSQDQINCFCHFFFIHAQRPKINPKFVLEAHSSLAQDCWSSLICWFSLCPFPIQSVSFQLREWVDTLFHPRRNPTKNTVFWSKWPCLPVSDSQPQNSPFFPDDVVLISSQCSLLFLEDVHCPH